MAVGSDEDGATMYTLNNFGERRVSSFSCPSVGYCIVYWIVVQIDMSDLTSKGIFPGAREKDDKANLATAFVVKQSILVATVCQADSLVRERDFEFRRTTTQAKPDAVESTYIRVFTCDSRHFGIEPSFDGCMNVKVVVSLALARVVLNGCKAAGAVAGFNGGMGYASW
ncbi:hypothetical protein KJE20_10436 [Pyrenophora tritici-repentis]|uniref:Uncharacterized protein n=1 Tax=Pyrenophora tritici-repentis TaxID=45151 RepID=A0A316ZSM7_9PLEO|nr:hypothetical protein Ptr86124_009582 [Pyrenophora tritici-repentis]KAI1679796.1 hypothetical protein KJE20_10436 [Pyrenophora tritici-repentis]